jgi:hypothetical protein
VLALPQRAERRRAAQAAAHDPSTTLTNDSADTAAVPKDEPMEGGALHSLLTGTGPADKIALFQSTNHL